MKLNTGTALLQNARKASNRLSSYNFIQLYICMYAFQTIKMDVDFSVLPTMALFGTKGQKLDRRQFIHAKKVTIWKGNVNENASTMAPGRVMSLSASPVS